MNLYDIAIARKLSGGGGGGSSDFSTAEVTIINNDSDDIQIQGAILKTEDGETNLSYEIYCDANAETVITFVLYKGTVEVKCWIGIGKTVTTTGGVTYAYGLATITGDGTITIS